MCFGDVSCEKEVLKMVKEVDKYFGRLDVLVNNAADRKSVV